MAAQADKIHMVIDLETVDTKRSAMITEASYIIFTKDEVLHDERVLFDVRDQILQGRTVSRDTVEWHYNNNTGLATVIYGGKSSLKNLENMIKRDVQEFKPDVIWSRGSFDKDILEDAIELPFKFWQWRDCRTLDEIQEMKGVNNHNSLMDCKNQMEHIRSVLYGLSDVPSLDGDE